MNGQVAGTAAAPAAGTSGGAAGSGTTAGSIAAAPAAGTTAAGSSAAGASAAGATGATAAGTGATAAPGTGAAGAAGATTTTAGAGGAPSAVAGGAAGTAGAAAPAAGSGSVTMMIPTGWASGGTKSMKGNYPDPFATAPMGAACQLYPSQTLGPCYRAMPMMREDISGGTVGLPLRLSFLVVRAGCTPIPGATVDIWHSGYNGIYSAFPTNSTCNPSTTNVMSEMFCRGVNMTDESGKVHFSTVFPGWYSGRAVHIHFTVRVNGREEVTSQLYFDDKLTTEVQSQGEYKDRGMRTTTNDRDMIFRSGGATPDEVIFQTAKRADGALHAWKVLSIG